MLKRLPAAIALAALSTAALVVAGAGSALAHECDGDQGGHGPHTAPSWIERIQLPDRQHAFVYSPAVQEEQSKRKPRKPKCRETPVKPNWRDQYIPLFGLEDRENARQRYDAQRWRDECEHHDREFAQQCAWYYGGLSGVPNRDSDERSPNEAHVGFAATHCFLFEFAHQCEDHDASYGESVHDAHGGALYVDVCLTPNPESKYCREGMQDTQAGVTIMDHFPCGMIVPIYSCMDEYHVIRPFDAEYTNAQMDNSQTETQAIADDPHRYLCGYGPGSEECVAPALPAVDVQVGVGMVRLLS